jgi:diguanylate cyclase (GGDEF)-like protein
MAANTGWPEVYPPSFMQLFTSRMGRRLFGVILVAASLPAGLAMVLGQGALIPVLVASVLAALVLGFLELRRYLITHVRLLQGARRVVAGALDMPIEVLGSDELAQLGHAFNEMTSAVERRLETLEHTHAMDRAVLSTLDTASIAQIVLDYLPALFPCRSASLTVLIPQGEHLATTWLSRREGSDQRRMASTRLGADDLANALEQPEWMVYSAGDPVPGYLGSLRAEETGPLIACPLHEAGELIGVLAAVPVLALPSGEARRKLRRIADRAATALGNARMMDQVRTLAFYDGLTRLPNRVLYRERLGQAIGRARPRGRKVAVCSLDLDHFGRINDTLGPAGGDQLIREVGARLAQLCRPGGAVEIPESSWDEIKGMQAARLGGDEFALILPDLDREEAALEMARQVLATLQEPIRLGTQEVFVTASIGIAIHPADGPDTETLHKNADAALASAKKEGRNTVERYVPTMNAEAFGRMRLEQELRKAVEHGEFTLWYQPVVDLRSRFATGAEALVRWDHPDRGLVSPAEFIQLCEESGLIVPLGEWSLRSVCAQAKRWEESGFSGLKVSVNLSARQLRQRGITGMIQDILHETGARADQLTIELTESLLMEQGGVVERRLRELAEMGIQLAIDDFGTGYSSLGYLKNFPVSTLKIDRTFIVDVATNKDAAAITTAIIALAKAMDLEVVAEGVETREQAEFLRWKGCQKAQGYLLGRPAPVQMFTEYLRARQRRQATA